MPNQRKEGKKKIGVWVTDEEQALQNAKLKEHGLKNVAELLKAIREGTIKVSPHIKTLAIAAVGTSGTGCLWLFFAVPGALYAASQLI